MVPGTARVSSSSGLGCEQKIACVQVQPMQQANPRLRPSPSTVHFLQASTPFSSVASAINPTAVWIPLLVRIAVPFNSSIKSLLTSCLTVSGSAGVPAIICFNALMSAAFAVWSDSLCSNFSMNVQPAVTL
jgi:hypothetical protein